MNAIKTVELLRKYNKCPECGSDKIGAGAGSVEVTDDTFKRACKCGWSIEVKEDEGNYERTDHQQSPGARFDD